MSMKIAAQISPVEPVLCTVPTARQLIGNPCNAKMYDWLAVKGDREPLIESVLLDGRRYVVIESLKTLPQRLKAREQSRAG